MFIRLGYDIEFEVPAPVAIVSMLSVHPSRASDLRAPDEIGIEPTVEVRSSPDFCFLDIVKSQAFEEHRTVFSN